MNHVPKLTPTDDPSGLGAFVVAVAEAALVVLHVTDTAAGEILGLVQAVIALVTVLWIRRHAWAPATVTRALGKRTEGGSPLPP